MKEEVLEYIRRMQAKGVKPEQIRVSLLQAGYPRYDVEEGMRRFSDKKSEHLLNIFIIVAASLVLIMFVTIFFKPTGQKLVIPSNQPEQKTEMSYTYLVMGKLAYDAGDFEGASRLFLNATLDNSQNPESYRWLGLSYYKMQEYGKAQQALQSAVSLRADDSTSLATLASLYYKQKNYSAATDFYTRSIKLKPTATAYSNLGWSLLRQKKFSEALSAFNQSVALGAASASVLTGLGSAYSGLGLSSEAKSSFEGALESDPTYDTALYSLGAIYLESGNLEDALSYLREAYYLHNSSSKYALALARYYFVAKDYASSKQFLDRYFVLVSEPSQAALNLRSQLNSNV